MFLTSSFYLYFIFRNFQAYLLLRNSILSSRNYSLCLRTFAKNILLGKNKSIWQQLPTPNFDKVCNWRQVRISYKIFAFLPHPITLLLVICFELPITQTVFDFPWRFKLSGVDCMMGANLIPLSSSILCQFMLNYNFFNLYSQNKIQRKMQCSKQSCILTNCFSLCYTQ